ncbi:MAG: histidine phosphatase family protein [Pseudomonadota bacterium]
MTRTLILTRHAKSSWSDPLLDDFDRPLNRRGRHSAKAIGAWLQAGGHVPGEVILSGARRTLDTWAGVSRAMPRSMATRSESALYHASAGSVLAILRGASAGTVMLIGHNPGIAEFAYRIVRGRVEHPRFTDYPTCATAVIRFDTNTWQAADWNQGELIDFVLPRELLK